MKGVIITILHAANAEMHIDPESEALWSVKIAKYPFCSKIPTKYLYSETI